MESSISLSRGNILAGVRNSEDCHIVIMASEELLGSRNDVSNDDGGAEREQYVLVIRMQDESVVHLS